jgi:hypothetical protein
MTQYVQIVNGLVKNVWDSPPLVPLGEDGWVEGFEDYPELLPRQEYGNFTYDITKNPVVISREVLEIPFEIRKNSLLQQNEQRFKDIVNTINKIPQAYTSSDVAKIRSDFSFNENVIETSANHDDLDKLVLKRLSLS